MTNPDANHRRRWSAFPNFAVAVLMLLTAAQAFAADAVERPYDPPVGSRWVIESETITEQVRPEGPRNSQIRMRSELTIDARTADGFRISYVNRGTTAEGNDPSLAILRSSIKALENVTIRATTDAQGKPVRVDNLEEAKAAMRAMKDGMFEPFKDKPQVLAMLNQMMSGLIDVDASQAAASYIDELSNLAKAQGTGMKPGEVRRSTTSAESPLGGGALKSNTVFELSNADAATGKRTYTSTKSYDAESLKDFMQSFSTKLFAAAGDGARPAQIDALVKSMKLSLDERAVYQVEDGMTRNISEKSVIVASAMGKTMPKTETRTVTVTPAP